MRRVRPGARGQDATARQTKIQIGIEAVFKAPADHERVCILNEPERCCRRGAMPRGENSATRRPAKRIKKIHEGIAPLSAGTPRIARGRGEKSRTGWSARNASTFGVDRRRQSHDQKRKKRVRRRKVRDGNRHFRMFPLSRDIGELSKRPGLPRPARVFTAD